MAVAVAEMPPEHRQVSLAESLGKLLQDLREVHGFKRAEDVALLVGIHPITLSKYETGRRATLLQALMFVVGNGDDYDGMAEAHRVRELIPVVHRLCGLYHQSPQGLLERSKSMRTWFNPYGESL